MKILYTLLFFSLHLGTLYSQLSCDHATITELECDKPVWGKLPDGYGANCDSYCHNWFRGYSGMEVVYKFHAPTDGRYVFDLDYRNYGWDDLDLFVLNSCNPNDCVSALSNTYGVKDDIVQVDLKAHQIYYIVVDRRYGHVRDFELKVSCHTSTDLCHAKANHLKCNQQIWDKFCEECGNRWSSYCSWDKLHYPGPEKVYKFWPETSGEYEFEIQFKASQGDIDLFVLGHCKPDYCVGTTADPHGHHYQNQKSGIKKIKVYLKAHEEYRIVVDRKHGHVQGFDLKVSCRYIDCTKAPWLKVDRTTTDYLCVDCGDRWNDYCHKQHGHTAHNGPEKVYQFRPTKDGKYLFDLDYYGGDLNLYVLDKCNPDECLSSKSNTVGSHDDVLVVELKKNKTYYIAVDQNSGRTSKFSLQVRYLGNCEEVIVKEMPDLAFFLNPDGKYIFDFDQIDKLDITQNAYDVTWTLDGKHLGSGKKIVGWLANGKRANLCLEWKRTIGHKDYCYRYCQEYYFPVHPSVCSSLEIAYDNNTASTLPLTGITTDEAEMWVLSSGSNTIDILRKKDEGFDPNSYSFPANLSFDQTYTLSLFFKDHLGRTRICSKTLCNKDFIDDAEIIQPRFIGNASQVAEGIYTYALSSSIDQKTRVERWIWHDGTTYQMSNEEKPVVQLSSATGHTGVSLFYRIDDCYYLKYLDLSQQDPFTSADVISKPDDCTLGGNVEIRIPNASAATILYWTDHKGEIISTENRSAVTVAPGIPVVTCHVLRPVNTGRRNSYYTLDAYSVHLPICAQEIVCGTERSGSLASETNTWNRNAIGLGADCTPSCAYNGRDALYSFSHSAGSSVHIEMTQEPQHENLSMFLLDENFQAISFRDMDDRLYCKGWNVDAEGNKVTGSRSVGEVIESNLAAGQYYILVEGGCGSSSTQDLKSTYRLELSCARDTTSEGGDEEGGDSISDSTGTEEDPCLSFEVHSSGSGISVSSERWEQTGEEDLRIFHGRVHETDSVTALELIEHSGARYSIPQNGTNRLAFQLWQRSEDTNDEGAMIRLLDADNDIDINLSFSTEGGVSFLDVGSTTVESSVRYDADFEAPLNVELQWDNDYLQIALNGRMVSRNRFEGLSALGSIEFQAGDIAPTPNLISDICLYTSDSTSRASGRISSSTLLEPTLFTASIYPNPLTRQAYVTIQSDQATLVDLYLYSASGQLLLHQELKANVGTSTWDLSATNRLERYQGMIHYRLESQNRRISGSLVKLY